MNNGKVRIYELSKELNLDNKDLLGICEGLNIVVKSHSSSISEAEAEQIVKAAKEKFPDRHNKAPRQILTDKGDAPIAQKTEPPKSLAPTTAPANPSAPGNQSAPQRPTEPKTRILQIEHKSDIQSKPSLMPQPPVTAQQPPLRPAAPPAPAVSRPVVRPTPVGEGTPRRPETAGEAANSNRAVRTTAPVQPPAAKPQLSGPPARPNAGDNTPDEPTNNGGDSTPTVPAVRSAAPNKPIPKSQLVKNEPPGSRPAVGAPMRSPGTSAPRKPVAKTEADAPPLNRPPARIVQIKPQGTGPTRPGAPAKDGAATDKDDTPTPIDLELKRPPLRKPVNKGKGWSKEEEEVETAKAKLPAKGKRVKTVVIDDDDDDDDLDGNDNTTETIVSLSIARPAKQKIGTGGGIRPAAVPAQRKKPVMKGDQQAKERSGNNKREQKSTVEKPESITLMGSITVRDLAEMLMVPETEIVKQLFFKGMAISVTQILDVDTATMVAEEMDVAVVTGVEQAAATKVTEMLDVEDLDLLQRRPPVVTIMGHVDHGKTTLLDAIRSTKVAQGEAGGITQHIGAYHVDMEHEGQTQQVVFLDTPGHEAFTAMRARGARVTDIAILVVAADDGVRPQTIEAIRHAQAAEVPIIVAINKIDKPGANPARVKQELIAFNLQSEDLGGDTIMVEVSALKGENLDTLLEMILLVADIEDLQANPDRTARGTVIEAHLDKAKGPVATLLVQNGTLRVGETLVAGHVFGKVRAMVDDRLARVEAAGPSFAVEVLGLSDVPQAGDEFEVFVEKEARAIADVRSAERRQSRLQQMMASRRVTLNSLSAKAQEGELKELNLILKADVQGSVEAILGSLRQLPQNEVQVRVLLSAAGEITETDVDLAAASGAVIIGFNTTLASGARAASDEAGVDVREYNIIYALLSDIQGAMEGLLDPEQVEEPLGQVEVRAVFQAGRGNIAGCYVLSGKALRNCSIRVLRKSQLVYEGTLDSLKRVKDDVREVNAGFECGIRLDKFNDWQEGDIIETFQMVSKRRTLSPV
ncbi:translation initiation factor IF-2 [Chamaesiphon minutus]|uniref:Translation initiation factor IF-2 n=1 Tax=Chamaesiphon minutus (strain ATCC 27169 / PCC 6605) TaxID=1173020 RepID=K9UJG3_CHAP6|nr:translation initiation factor IF-2 [Chamaesiphon minutus]AFY94601.1 translation initiation factor IF-2 [Chamaesiphon minutus PCC 6605]